MAAISMCEYGFDQSLLSIPRLKARVPVISLPLSQLFVPNLSSNHKSFTSLRLTISCRKNKASEKWFRMPAVSCLMEGSSESCSGKSQSSVSHEEVSIDLKLPRRSLLVAFTCNICGARSERCINRLAYERGLVYVQCSGCSQFHKLVDNLGLVVEYKLQDEDDVDTNEDQT